METPLLSTGGPIPVARQCRTDYGGFRVYVNKIGNLPLEISDSCLLVFREGSG